MSMRCFIAIELEDFIVNNLSALRKQLQTELWGHDKGLKWVKSDNMHLTIKFLGDIDDSKINEVCKSCDKAAQAHEQFDIELGEVGTFPPHGAARVIWAGLTSGQDQLKGLYNSVEEELDKLEIPKEGRKFNPHATLARIKLAETGKYACNIVENLHVLPFGCQGVESLTIFNSTLEPDGPSYEVIHRSSLR